MRSVGFGGAECTTHPVWKVASPAASGPWVSSGRPRPELLGEERLGGVGDLRTPELGQQVAAGGEGHRADLGRHVHEGHPERDRALGVERPVVAVLVPRRVTPAGLLEQPLVVVEPHAVGAEETSGDLSANAAEHEAGVARVGPPEVERLQERLAVGVAFGERARVVRTGGALLDDHRPDLRELGRRGQAPDHGVALRTEGLHGVVSERMALGQGGRGHRPNGNVTDRAAARIQPAPVERGVRLVAPGHGPDDHHTRAARRLRP